MRPRLYCQGVLGGLKVKMDCIVIIVTLIILTPLFMISCGTEALRGSRSYQHTSNEAIQGKVR